MDAIECIISRTSIKEFRPEPVLNKILSEINEAVRRSHSYKNSQPWELTKISGAKKAKVSSLLIDLLEQVKSRGPMFLNRQYGLQG